MAVMMLVMLGFSSNRLCELGGRAPELHTAKLGGPHFRIVEARVDFPVELGNK